MNTSSGSQTQRTEPPKYQLPFLQHGVQEARNLYNRGPQVVGPSMATEAGLNGIAGLASGGNPITGAAGDFAQRSLTGGFLGSNPYLRDSLNAFTSQGPNPYLDATFDRAALATQNRLASQFAGSGRNIDASRNLRAGELNDLATSIYGGAYDSDRNRQLQAIGMQAQGYEGDQARQMQTLGMSPGLANSQYADFDRLLGVGQAREGYQQTAADAQGQHLDDYINRVSGNMGTTVKTSGGGNSAAGMFGGLLGLGGLMGIF